MSASRMVALVLVALSAASVAYAGSYIVPTDADLIDGSDAIAIVSVQSKQSYFTSDRRIATDYRARVERALKGDVLPGATITLTQLGGAVGDTAMIVSGEPAFAPGERALVMLQRLGPSRFSVAPGELGKFSFAIDSAAREILVRGATEGEIFGWDLAGQRHAEEARDAKNFLRFIERVVAREAPTGEARRGAAQLPPFIGAESHVSGNDYMTQFDLGGTSRGARWPTGSFTMQSIGTQGAVANLGASINTARGAWNGDPNSSITIGYSGVASGGSYGDNDGKFLIFFDQLNSGPLGGSVVGQATIWAEGGTNSNGSDTYFNSVDCDIIIEAGLSGSVFEAVLGHEMGHCLGFRHSNQPGSGQTTTSTNALMNSTAPSSATLRTWDADAASHVYGSGASACFPPSITTHPAPRTITVGQSATLTVAAAGTAPLTYQWYQGDSGVTTTPVGTNSASLTVSPPATTSYWVRVSGTCGSPASSNTAVITVAACTPPSINTQPQSQTITSGQNAVLTVGVGGTGPMSYQWFVGTSGNTSNPLGATGSTISVSPTATTSYWVRITGQCGTPAQSSAATVMVTASCEAPSITVQPLAQSILAGGTAVLTVGATGTNLSYQWFSGVSGDTSSPLPGATSATLSVAPATTTSYWLRVTGQCGTPVASNAAVVTVAAACVPPAIVSVTASQTVVAGSTVSLSVATSGTAVSYSWFEGPVGDTSRPVGTTASVVVGPVRSSTNFWVRVTNNCGSVDSASIQVTVSPGRRRAVRK